MNKFTKYWLPVLIWMGIIFFFSSMPDLKSGLKEDFILRKLAHVLEFAILTFLFLRALSAQGGPASGREHLNNKKIVIYSILFVLFYAISDEYHQTFVLGRQGALGDVGIDSIGILLMGLLWYIKEEGRK